MPEIKNKLKIVHFSDTHLGFSDLNLISDDNKNIREQDIYRTFLQVIDRIIEIKPDIAIHSGDLFHRSSPINAAISTAIEGFARLDKADIPAVVISGNHSTPKTIYSGPILKALESFKNIYPVYDQKYRVEKIKNANIHCIPYSIRPEGLNENIALMEKNIKKTDDSNFNILVLHCSVGKQYLMDEYGEEIFPVEKLPLLKKFDYVALGHWHSFRNSVENHNNTFYSGSTDCITEKEVGKDKIIIEVDFAKSKSPASIKLHKLEIRTQISVKIVNCHKKHKDTIISEIKKQLPADLKDTILRISLIDVDMSQYPVLNLEAFSQAFPGTFHIILKKKPRDEKAIAGAEDIKTKGLNGYFEDFISEKQKSTRVEKEVIDIVQKYLNMKTDE